MRRVLHASVRGVGVDHGAAAHDVVDDDDRSGPRELERPLEVVAGSLGLSASMNTRSNGSGALSTSRGSVSSARPDADVDDGRRRPARARLARATSACCGSISSVIRRPPGGRARASQIVL